MIRLILERIDPMTHRQAVAPGAGADLEFAGIVRPEEGGQPIKALHYEVYPGMTERQLAVVEAEVLAKFPLLGLVIVHRHGSIPVGETALWVQVQSAHRKEALEALEFAVRRIKEIVPVWKGPAG
ncbi:MAG: molybdenum cofactor biosynthesis protein MoaE [Planctomycetota bacterium]